MSCGTTLGAVPAPEPFRKVVTIQFTDVVNSTALGERLDPETLSEVMTAYFDAIRGIIARHEGTVAKFMGDAVLAVFGVPRLHEDDALRAVRAAADMRAALASLNERLEGRWGVQIATRTGIHTGVVAGTGVVPDQDFVAGDTGNVAARLQQVAGPGEILMSEATYRLTAAWIETERLPPLELKGKAEPVIVHRLRRVRMGHEVGPVAHRTSMVGRKDELDVLRWTLERATEERASRLVTIVGAAGVGKSRLVEEFLREVGPGATVLRGRCLPYGDGTTFWPLVEIVKQAAGITDDDPREAVRVKLEARLGETPEAPSLAGRLAQLAGVMEAEAAPASPSFAVARLLRGIAEDGPVVAVVDDLHWAEPSLLAIIEEVVRTAGSLPMIVLCVTRTEFVETNPGWGASDQGTRIELTPLNQAECERMTGMLLSEVHVPAAVRTRISAAAEGNPLYVEQLVSMLVDDGVLARDGGGVTAPAARLDTISVPPGIHALLAGRLERLDREERGVLGAAAVIGQVFYLDALRALVPDAIAEQVPRTLIELTRKDFVWPTRTDIADQEAFAFKHQLIRDVAYEALSKSQRAGMHEAVADWLESAMGDRAPELGEILGYHLEQAHRYRADLGPLDADGRRVADRAASWLARAGWRSSALGDPAAGVSLRRRALALMAPDAPERPQVLAELGDALLWRGQFDEAKDALAAAIGSSGEASLRTRRLARLSQLRLEFQIDPDADYGAIEREAIEAAEALEASGDDFGAARAWRVAYWARWGMCRLEDMRPAAERAFMHDERSHDPQYFQDDLIGVLVALVWGPTPASEALRQGRVILEKVRGHRGAEAYAMCFIGQLHGMLGQDIEARELIGRGVATRHDLGDHPGAAMSHAEGLGYFVEMVRGDAVAAERELRSGYDMLKGMGDKNYFAITAGWLAHALLALGRDDDAQRIIEECRQAAARGWVAAQVLWRGAEAILLARRGVTSAAETLAREAVTLALATDRVDTQTDALMDLAEVLSLAGSHREAADVVDDVLRRLEAKEVRPAAARARQRVRELRAMTAAS